MSGLAQSRPILLKCKPLDCARGDIGCPKVNRFTFEGVKLRILDEVITNKKPLVLAKGFSNLEQIYLPNNN
ncbi:hypothetical protein LY08_00372 [Olleya aquimaris]|uniref:Uncharacterized protein n=1 Tax=Olleya aquimaris TaxID=639310 RepID=A0A327RME9_9FLAO|nr:hypothetical protein LY08_00372 [Olleya aquimaris]